jgi:hypothetical protein
VQSKNKYWYVVPSNSLYFWKVYRNMSNAHSYLESVDRNPVVKDMMRGRDGTPTAQKIRAAHHWTARYVHIVPHLRKMNNLGTEIVDGMR